MSLLERILRIARAESLHRRRQVLGGSPAPDPLPPEDLPPEDDAEPRIPMDGARFTEEVLAPHFAALEVPPDASSADVKQAWRTLMQRYHPDLHHANEKKREAATDLTRRLTESYRILTAHLERRETRED